jgi:hypothetical protein
MSVDQLLDQIFCMRKISITGKYESQRKEDKQFTDSKKTYELFRREFKEL